jgi:putative hydrolase of the HAD superfamily
MPRAQAPEPHQEPHAEGSVEGGAVAALTFDLDDTLYDNRPVLESAEAATHRWLRRRCPRLAARYDVAMLRSLRRRLAEEQPEISHDYTAVRKLALARAARETGYPEAVAEEAFQVFFEARQRVTFYADVLPALEALSARFPIAVVTNGNADVSRLGIGHFFRFALTPAQAGAAKPAAAIFHEAARRLGVAPGAVLHVGDDPQADVAGAMAAGLRSAWLNRAGGPWQGPEPPHYEVRSLSELTCRL